MLVACKVDSYAVNNETCDILLCLLYLVVQTLIEQSEALTLIEQLHLNNCQESVPRGHLSKWHSDALLQVVTDILKIWTVVGTRLLG